MYRKKVDLSELGRQGYTHTDRVLLTRHGIDTGIKFQGQVPIPGRQGIL